MNCRRFAGALRSRRMLAVAAVCGLALVAFAWLPRGYAHANLAPPPTAVEWAVTAGSDGLRGVVHHDLAAAFPGYHLFDPFNDARAYLLDMRGQIVHTWSFMEPVPGGPPPAPGARWMALEVLPDGSLLLVRDQELVVRLSWYSELIGWHRVAAHHDIAVQADGTLCTWATEMRPHRGKRTEFSQIAFLAPDLRPLGTGLHTADLVERYPCPSAEAEIERAGGWSSPVDYYHENAISVIGPSALAPSGPWTPGNLLVSLRNIDRVMVLDRVDQRVLWEWGDGVLERPHNPRLLPSGRLLVFDNGTRRKRSRVLELDPERREITWSYPPEGSAARLYSEFAGAAQRLGNGNTLITESDEGRAIEVTPAGEVVWEFLHPAGVRLNGSVWHPGRIYRLHRYPSEWFAARLAAQEGRPGPHPVWWE